MPLKTVNGLAPKLHKGRGAALNLEGRFETERRESFDNGWDSLAQQDERQLRTSVTRIQAKSIITYNESPDLGFDRSINPYQGCEHGCIYCYARPTHAYFNLSPGLDFETRLFAKVNAAELLRKELSARAYQPALIALGANTDPYQPAERQYQITRQVLQVLAECNHPVGIVTKNALIERDIDILAPLARKNLAVVFISVTNLDHELARHLEPRATAPSRRVKVIQNLTNAGIPVGVLVAPVIPFLTDHQLESVLEACYAAGARKAGYVLLRLPYEIKDLFKDWLEQHYPLKAKHVMSRVTQMRDGRENDAQFFLRQKGSGEFAELLAKRFEIACRKFGLNVGGRYQALDTTQFRPPSAAGQMRLF